MFSMISNGGVGATRIARVHKDNKRRQEE